MDFSHVERTPHPRDLVYRTHRDELEAVTRRIDAVRRVERRSSSTHAQGKLEQRYRWYGSHAALPLFVRPFIKEELLVWEQHTIWDPAQWRADWRIEVPGLGAGMHCAGTNVYLEESTGTCIEVQGSFEFNPQRVPQLRQVPETAGPVVERMVVALILPLIKQSGAAVSAYLDGKSA